MRFYRWKECESKIVEKAKTCRYLIINRHMQHYGPQPHCHHTAHWILFYFRFGDKYLWGCLVWQLVKHKSIGYNTIWNKWTLLRYFDYIFIFFLLTFLLYFALITHTHTHTRLFDSTYSPIFPRCASHFEFNAYKSFDLIYHLFVYVVQPFFPPRSFSSSCVFPSNCVKFM